MAKNVMEIYFYFQNYYPLNLKCIETSVLLLFNPFMMQYNILMFSDNCHNQSIYYFLFIHLNSRMTKVKILCMHGYGTNANFMKKQSIAFQKIIEQQAQLIFVDGPFEAPQNFVMDQKVIDMIEGKHRSWAAKTSSQDLQEDLAQLDKLRIAFENASDHYDGILGFSQGGMMLHFLLRLKDSGLINWKILQGIKFSINLNTNHLKYRHFNNSANQLDIPSLHIISPQDFLYPKSIIHITQFKDPIVISHSYGHRFPKLGLNEAKVLLSFIRKHSGKEKKKQQNFQILSLTTL